MTDIVERLRNRALVAAIIKDNPALYNDAADVIISLCAENEKLREALKPFAYNYQNNSLSHSMFIFEMKDLLAAKKALESGE